jgi:hypothetical protein
MATSRTNYLRVLGATVTALVLFAVPAVAIGLADFSSTPEVGLATQMGQAAAAEDLVILNNWQFTDSKTDHPKNTDHPKPPKNTDHPNPPPPPLPHTKHTDHPKNTDHRKTDHPHTDHKNTDHKTKHTDHKSHHTSHPHT